jgi:DNA-binding response OmpR family regulator
MQSGDVSAVPLGLRVLVVEDDAASRDAICRGLAAHGGVMLEAVDGVGALQQAAVGKPDVIVLDLMLPMLDGEHVIHRLRQTSDVPIVVVSAKRSEVDRVRALDLGADDYLCKPFSLRELVARLRAVLRRTQRAASTVGLPAGFLLDRSARAVLQDGQRVPLTPQEFAVLDLLVRNRGKIVSRGEIDQVIHPHGEADVSNVIDVIILRLRKKLGRDRIVTRRGQGFLIDAPVQED